MGANERLSHPSLDPAQPGIAGLADSPILQLAWIAEKFVRWANPATPISRENVLITASLYWFTRTGPAAAEFYWELVHVEDAGWDGSATMPHGSSLFYSDPLVRKVLGPAQEGDFFREHVEGGHFPAFEVSRDACRRCSPLLRLVAQLTQEHFWS